MILLNTSVLISYLKGKEAPECVFLNKIIEQEIPFGINFFIYQEVLQGSRNEKEFSLLKDYLSSLIFYELLDGIDSYEAAARKYYICRKNGITIRSTIDMLIAQTAIENNLYLLHDDKDFTSIKKIFPELKDHHDLK